MTSAKAEKTIRLLQGTYEVGDRVWWAGPGRWYKDAGVVHAVRDGVLIVLWDTFATGSRRHE